MSLSVLGIRPAVLVRFYGWRLRRHGVQELLAAIGIAVGVALVFGVLVANTSVTGSASQIAHSLIGGARLQLAARSADGFDQRLAERARQLPGVAAAVPVLRTSVSLQGPGGRQSIQLVGVNSNIASLGGRGTQNFGRGGLRLSGGLVLPASVANAIGARAGQTITMLVFGRARRVLVGTLLGSSMFGTLGDSPVAVALLPVAQSLIGKPGRVTQVVVKPRPGQDRVVAAGLQRLAAGRVDVERVDNELRLLRATAKPNDQATTLFAAISGMVGFLLALNAMLLTVPERRRFVAELRMQGFDPRQVLYVLGFEALVLGIGASLVGVLLGELLSRTLFDRMPVFLSVAFPVGSHQVVHLTTILLALGGGVLATLFASLAPSVFDLLPGRPIDAAFRAVGEAGEGMGSRTTAVLGVLGGALVVIVTALVLIVPSLTVLGGVTLALATLCLVPAVFQGVTHAVGAIGRHIRGSMLIVAVLELRATTTRSIALAGVGALAVYGSVAVRGAEHDLLHGLDQATVEFFDTSDVWVTTGDNDLTTSSFQAGGAQAAIARAPQVASVRVYQGGFLDVGSRRLWIRARPPQDRAVIQASQLLQGRLGRASGLIRAGGWAAVSVGFAQERDLHVGDSFTLPTPAGQARLGVAAITTNGGWSPGAITMSTSDYQRYWQTREPTALEVNLRPGVSPAAGKRAVQGALGADSPLLVQTHQERDAQFKANARQGLRSLSQISTLLLISAALAVASSLSAAIWQRRVRLASLKLQGFDYRQLWHSLLLESAIVLSIGCAVGAVLGVYGHALASRWLKLTTGFPAPFSLGVVGVLLTFLFVAGIALAVVALPGFLASQVPPRASFQE
ncbi:MAG TPA: ABC transporter permease [Solirubrobacteraceae bacterium]|nr:ABC transporter permease [Solirubrobacteraceae bacterium]